MVRTLIIEADGGSRGNPGEAGSGAVVCEESSGLVLAKAAVYLGVASNNVAEYRALIAGITRALELDSECALLIRMDSKLVVEQMSGRWKIKHPDMKVLAAEAAQLLRGKSARFEWIPREKNFRADALANQAMDTRTSFSE